MAKKDDKDWKAWETERDSDEFRLEIRKNRESGLLQTRISSVIHCSSKKLWDLLVDPETYMEVMPKTIKSEYLNEKPKKKTLHCYQLVRAKPISERDYTLLVKWTESKTKHGTKYHRFWTVDNDQGPDPIEDVVRVEVNEGSWTLTPKSAKKTMFEQVSYIELGGSLWTVLANGAIKDAPKDLVRTLHERFPE